MDAANSTLNCFDAEAKNMVEKIVNLICAIEEDDKDNVDDERVVNDSDNDDDDDDDDCNCNCNCNCIDSLRMMTSTPLDDIVNQALDKLNDDNVNNGASIERESSMRSTAKYLAVTEFLLVTRVRSRLLHVMDWLQKGPEKYTRYRLKKLRKIIVEQSDLLDCLLHKKIPTSEVPPPPPRSHPHASGERPDLDLDAAATAASIDAWMSIRQVQLDELAKFLDTVRKFAYKVHEADCYRSVDHRENRQPPSSSLSLSKRPSDANFIKDNGNAQPALGKQGANVAFTSGQGDGHNNVRPLVARSITGLSRRDVQALRYYGVLSKQGPASRVAGTGTGTGGIIARQVGITGSGGGVAISSSSVVGTARRCQDVARPVNSTPLSDYRILMAKNNEVFQPGSAVANLWRSLPDGDHRASGPIIPKSVIDNVDRW